MRFSLWRNAAAVLSLWCELSLTWTSSNHSRPGSLFRLRQNSTNTKKTLLNQNTGLLLQFDVRFFQLYGFAFVGIVLISCICLYTVQRLPISPGYWWNQTSNHTQHWYYWSRNAPAQYTAPHSPSRPVELLVDFRPKSSVNWNTWLARSVSAIGCIDTGAAATLAWIMFLEGNQVTGGLRESSCGERTLYDRFSYLRHVQDPQ